ncbi:hypothetical protein M0638_06285 [Roseomonas sp. NAR14]|uniref:Uncharacterized protein n=1 Tax=Roseomonas acroporae TaxID=2937791 RepID=A0A9X2BT87_9PROT|nr:hypothetical protein [Roseomonas acroporae]MCK8783987.1 hypothetical protein [Roseomonas acroporae]
MLARSALAVAVLALTVAAAGSASANLATRAQGGAGQGAGCPGAVMEGGGENLVIRYAPGNCRLADSTRAPEAPRGVPVGAPASGPTGSSAFGG